MIELIIISTAFFVALFSFSKQYKENICKRFVFIYTITVLVSLMICSIDVSIKPNGSDQAVTIFGFGKDLGLVE